MKVFFIKTQEDIAFLENLLKMAGFCATWYSYDEQETIVLNVLTPEEAEQDKQEIRRGIKPSLFERRKAEIATLLKKNGFTVEDPMHP